MKLRYIIGALILGFFLACGGSGDKPKANSAKKEGSSAKSMVKKDESAASNKKGKLVFKQYCIVCHGADGKLAVSGAKDLSISKLSKEERILQVTNGKGLMTPYKDILSAEQIASVVDYLEELRN
jgi:mono/diheme cytochrome c family protein